VPSQEKPKFPLTPLKARGGSLPATPACEDDLRRGHPVQEHYLYLNWPPRRYFQAPRTGILRYG